MKKLLTTLSMLALASTLSFAEDKPPGPPPGQPPGGDGKGGRPAPEEVFKRLDTNSDGAISLDEFKASPRGQRDPAKAEEAFKKMDKDGNGSLNLEEFKTGRPPGRPPGPGGPGGDRPGRGPGGGKPPGGAPQ